MEGVATTLTSWSAGMTRVTMPPRATFTRLESGAALGGPNDPDQQRRVLDATLALLSLDAPIDPVRLDERIDGGPPA